MKKERVKPKLKKIELSPSIFKEQTEDIHQKIDSLSGSTDELVDKIEQQNKEGETSQSNLWDEPSLHETSENNLSYPKDKSDDVKGISLLISSRNFFRSKNN